MRQVASSSSTDVQTMAQGMTKIGQGVNDGNSFRSHSDPVIPQHPFIKEVQYLRTDKFIFKPRREREREREKNSFIIEDSDYSAIWKKIFVCPIDNHQH